MKENRTHHYEIMILFQQSAATNLGAAVEHIREIFARAEGELLSMKKWDERRLAYEIKKQKRGLYILAYVTLPTAKVAVLERALNLSDMVLRWILVRADHLSLDEMKALDAQTELADEIVLRAKRAKEHAEGSSDSDNESQPETETETAAAQA